jgi:hypothetical protein
MKPLHLALPFDYLARGAAGVLLAGPITAVVTATGIGSFPEGDRLLFQPGGLYLVEALRTSWPLLAPLAAASLGTALLVAIALVLPQAALWTALVKNGDREPLTAFVGRAVGRVPALLSLQGVTFLAQVLVWGATFGLLGAVHQGAWGSAPGPDLAALAIPALGAALVLLLGVVRDLGAAASVAGRIHGRAALRAGFACLRHAPVQALTRWMGPALLGLSLVGAGGLAAGALDVGRAGSLRFLGVGVLHQLVVAALVGCRAAWFNACLELVAASSRPARAPADTPGRSGALADPS